MIRVKKKQFSFYSKIDDIGFSSSLIFIILPHIIIIITVLIFIFISQFSLLYTILLLLLGYIFILLLKTFYFRITFKVMI